MSQLCDYTKTQTEKKEKTLKSQKLSVSKWINKTSSGSYWLTIPHTFI